jgi:protein required for attachment to host cells
MAGIRPGHLVWHIAQVPCMPARLRNIKAGTGVCVSHDGVAENSRGPMTKIQIPHDAIVFVGDGRKALLLRNEGDEKFPNLKTERVFADDNPPTHEQGTDKPGRSCSSVGHGRSAVSQTDWHELEEHHFTRMVAEALEKLVRENHVKALLVAAPPRTLADLRQAFHKDVKARIIAEVGKDLTKEPVYEIEKHLAG